MKNPFSRLWKKENRSTESLADLDRRMDAAVGYGVNGVSDKTAMNMATVFNAATIRTQYLAMVPLVTYYSQDGKKEKFKGSPIYSLLHDKPNPLMTSFSWRSTMELHALFYGGGFSRIERDTLGRPIYLWLLDGRCMSARLTADRRGLEWEYRKPDGQVEIIRDENVLHIPGLSFDGVNGEGIIKLAARSMNISQSAEAFGEKFYSNGLNAGGALQHPGTLSDEAFKHLKESLEKNNSGLVNAYKPLILEEGLTWNKITFSPEEAQFLATRQFQDVEIARWFNLPLRMLKMPDASGLRNVEQISIEMVQGTMLPRYVAWEQELNTKLFGINANRFAEFNVDGLLRGDAKTRADVSHIMRLDGALNANEWRARENMNPIEGDKGEEYWGQPNLAANKSNTDDDDDSIANAEIVDLTEEGDDAES